MNNELIKIIKRCYKSLVDDSGNSKEKADCYLINTSDNNIKIIKEIVGIIIRSDNVSIETKIFISNDGWSIKDTNLEINRLRENAQRLKREMVKPLSYNNTTLKISADNNKLEKIVDIRVIKDLVYNRIEDYEKIEEIINTLIIEYGDCDNSRNNLMLDIDKNILRCNSYKNNEEFFEILSSLESYLVQRKAIVEKVINNNKEFVEYFNYLLNKESIHNKEVERDRERLLKFLNNEDYMTGYESESNEDCDSDNDESEENFSVEI